MKMKGIIEILIVVLAILVGIAIGISLGYNNGYTTGERHVIYDQNIYEGDVPGTFYSEIDGEVHVYE